MVDGRAEHASGGPGDDRAVTLDGSEEREVPLDGMPTLSVCVPTFERPQLVQQAIASIVESASVAPSLVEIIVSDNSPAVSELACREALRAWQGRSTYIGNPRNIGIAANLNRCIERATGRYIVFAHDDDRLLPGAVSGILNAIPDATANDKVLFFGVHLADAEGHVLRRQEFCRDERVTPIDALDRLLSDNSIAWFPGLVVARDGYAAVGPFDAGVGNATDLEMWVRLFAAFGVRCIPSTISAYTVHTGSATQSMAFDEDALAGFVEIFDRARATGALTDDIIDRCQAQFLQQVILGATFMDMRAERMADAREVLALFKVPSVNALRPPLEWLLARWITALLVRSPTRLVRPLVSWVDRHELVSRLRALGGRGHGQLPLC
jgi:hypothetical protein